MRRGWRYEITPRSRDPGSPVNGTGTCTKRWRPRDGCDTRTRVREGVRGGKSVGQVDRTELRRRRFFGRNVGVYGEKF